MRRRLFWPLVTMGSFVVTILLVKQHFVLDSEKLEYAITNELPLGSSKARVVAFIENRHPIFCEDLGLHVKARLSGVAGNMIYRKDVILIFEFDPAVKLLSHSRQEYLTFL